MASVSDVDSKLNIPCLFLDQCRCSIEEENPAVTSIYLKHGKTYESSHNGTVFDDDNKEVQSSSKSENQSQLNNISGAITKSVSKNENAADGKRSRRSRKPKREFTSPANQTNSESVARESSAELDDATQFQILLTNCEERILKLKSAVDRLKTAQETETGKNKETKHRENILHVITMQSKIDELEMQKSGAVFGFNRASLCADSEIRKKREIFRLTEPLPALSKRQDFENAVNENQFIVVMGQTGSGKSTQLTQYLADMPQFEKQFVICTQPRKIAAVTLTRRVAFEFAAGKETAESKKWVGCHVGGENRLHLNNRIQYMTETVLLNQLTASEVTREDPFLNCGAIIVDEAHSRTITTDVLLGVLKRKIHLWPHLKVIVTSATIDTNLFSEYLGGCPVIDIPGRLYPVEVIYRPFDRDNSNVIEAVVKQAITICNTHQSGDILCFLTGQNEVEWATQKFSASIKPSASRAKRIVAYPLYGKQTPEEQQMVFDKTPDVQKVIFSTDIAETSVTIDGVKFIVDSGMTKNLVFDSARNITSLKEMMISSASAEQRKGRAGRTGPGICYRMYSEDDYNSLAKYDKAEIFLRPLSITVTLLKAMRVDPLDFHWLEKPDSVALRAAVEELSLLGALDHRQNLTPLGHLISDLQIDPGIAHMIYYSCCKGLGKVATILAGLFSVSSMVFWRGGDDDTRRASDEAKKKFVSDRGDIFSSHRVFTEWLTQKEADSTLRTAKTWCKQNYVNNKAMNMALSTSQEIQLHLRRNASHMWKRANQDRQATDEELLQLIAQAFVLNVAYQVNKNYVALRADTMTYVHPGSVFFRHKEPPQVIAYQSVLHTSKTYAMQLTPIDMGWIRQENGALHALYEELATQVNIKEIRVTPVSRGILRFILGPANRNVEELNKELDCLVHSDYENDALVAWCKPHACNFVISELSRRVESRKTELEQEIREDPVVGETRIVWGCGGEAKILLFYGNFIGITLRNVPSSWNLSDVDITVRQKLSQPIKDSFKNIFFLPKNADQTNKTARILFNDPYKAATALQELSAGGGLRGKMECSPALSNRPSVYKESEAWLTITFAIAESKNSSIIMYNTLEDANQTLRLGCLGFRPSKSDPHKKLSKFDPTVVNGYFIKQANPFNVRITYVLYGNRLPPRFDELDVENELNRYGCPKPTYIKIIRGNEILRFEKQPTSTEEESDLILNYAKSNELLPLSDKVIKTFVRKDPKRKTVTIRARYESMDQIEMIYVSRLCATTHISQPVRLKAQIRTSLRLEKNLWEFRQKEIQEYVTSLKTKDVFCKFETNPTTHVWLHLEVPRAENIDDIRRKIGDFLQFRFYKNNDSQLFFTHYGQKRLAAFDARPGYLHFNAAAKAIRIYGTETERQEISHKLDNLIENFKLFCIDVPLIVRKTSLNVVGNNLAKYRNAGLIDDLRLFYNRLYATGSENGIETLKNDLKDHIIQPRADIESGDCGLCFSPLENPTYLQMCAHKYCSECIKHMVNQETVPYPILCPADGCDTKVCLRDIQAIAPASIMEKIGQAAINALLHDPKSKDKYQSCFKTGCEQYIPINDSKLEEKEQMVRGGDTVFCDQCNLHYCRTCCNTLKKPVERHRGVTCASNQLGESKDVGLHRLYILDELCNLRCPRCKRVFIDFVGCCALYCSCKAGFCFFCLEDCGSDAHSHVRSCPKNTGNGVMGVFINASQKNTVHRESRKRAIVEYLMRTCIDRGLRSSILHSIEKDLKDLEIVISPNEVGLAGFTPLADTSKHRKHILDEICTLRCPRCRSAFFDYEGCSAIQCWNAQCKTHFCFFCLQDCGDDQKNHAHVIKCPKNVVPGQLYTPAEQIDIVNCKRRKEGIIQYLMSHCSDPSERQAVIDSVSVNLKHLNVVIRHEDLNPPVPRVPVPLRPVEHARPVNYRPVPQYVPQRPLIPERPVLPPIEPIRRVPIPDPYIRHAPIPDPYVRRVPIPDPYIRHAPIPDPYIRHAPIPDPYVRRVPIPDPRPAERPPPPRQKKDCVIL